MRIIEFNFPQYYAFFFFIGFLEWRNSSDSGFISQCFCVTESTESAFTKVASINSRKHVSHWFKISRNIWTFFALFYESETIMCVPYCTPPLPFWYFSEFGKLLPKLRTGGYPTDLQTLGGFSACRGCCWEIQDRRSDYMLPSREPSLSSGNAPNLASDKARLKL